MSRSREGFADAATRAQAASEGLIALAFYIQNATPPDSRADFWPVLDDVLRQWQERATDLAERYPGITTEDERTRLQPVLAISEMLSQVVGRTQSVDAATLARGITDVVQRELPTGATWCLGNVQVTKDATGALEVQQVAMH